jgi:hypothetical protein
MSSKDEKYFTPKEIFEKYVEKNQNVTWPSTDKEKQQLARLLFGDALVGDFDSWIMHAFDYIENSKTTSSSKLKNKREKFFSEGLKDLSSEQKDVVKRLVLETAHGVFFSMMVALDQCPYGDYELKLKTFGEETDGVLLTSDEFVDLHDEVFEWT